MNTSLGEFLRPEGFAGPRGLRELSREASLLLEGGRLARRRRTARRAATGLPYAGAHKRTAHDPVVLVPGFLAGDYTLVAMAAFLRQQGFRTYRSGINVNVGCTREAADRLERRLESIVLRRGRKVSVVGHSLGGMLARGLAARRPDLIDGIVSMGSPIVAPGAIHGVLEFSADMLTRLTSAGFGGLMSEDCIAGGCARESFEDTRAPLADGIGFTAIYSKRDGIVDWKACVDPAAIPVEVPTSHCGMAIDPLVMDHVLSALQQQRISRANSAGAPAEPGVVRLAASR